MNKIQKQYKIIDKLTKNGWDIISCSFQGRYEIIAENIRKERRRLGITQAELAERADVSLDTIKSIENGRRAMSLDTYLNIVHALESSPMVLMSQQHPEKHIERFAFMMNRCDEREIEFALHMIEQILRGQEDYLSE